MLSSTTCFSGIDSRSTPPAPQAPHGNSPSDVPKDPKLDRNMKQGPLKELMIHVEPLRPAPSSLPVSPLPSGFPGDSTRCVREPHACTHSPPDGHRLWYTASRTPGLHESQGLSPLSAKGPSSQQISNLGKRPGCQPISPLKTFPRGPLGPDRDKSQWPVTSKRSKK